PRRQTRIGTAPLLMPLTDICAPGAVIIGSARARDDQTRPGGRALKEHLLATTPPPLLVMDRPYGRTLARATVHCLSTVAHTRVEGLGGPASPVRATSADRRDQISSIDPLLDVPRRLARSGAPVESRVVRPS